jgi:hypothetical protein
VKKEIPLGIFLKEIILQAGQTTVQIREDITTIHKPIQLEK